MTTLLIEKHPKVSRYARVIYNTQTFMYQQTMISICLSSSIDTIFERFIEKTIKMAKWHHLT